MSYLMRRDPFRGLVRMQDEMDRLFQGLFGTGTAEGAREGVRVPPVDVSETAEEVVVRAELPGIGKEDLELEVLPEMLTLKGAVSQESEEKGETFHRRERSWSSFQRSLPLPAEVKTEGVKATLEHGVLEVHLPKTDRAKVPTPKKVTID